MPSIHCPSCQAQLRTPTELPAQRRVKCPKCGQSFQVGKQPAPDAAPISEFWEKARINEAIDSAPKSSPELSAKPTGNADNQPRVAGTKTGAARSLAGTSKTKAPIVEAAPPAPPATESARSRLPIIIAAAAGGLSIGLGIALLVLLNSRGSNDPRAIAPHIALAEGKSTQPETDSISKPLPENAPPVATPAAPLPKVVTEPAKPAAPTPMPEPTKWAFENWPQDIAEAQQLARQQNKDLLLLFDGSDWSANSKAMATQVFARPENWKRLSDRFVLVHIDFPKFPTAERRVRDAARNQQLLSRYFKNPAYPRTVLADADARPYALHIGYEVGNPEKFVSTLERATQTRAERDLLLTAVANADGKTKLAAAHKALEFLDSQIDGPSDRGDGTAVLDLQEFYGPLLVEWRRLSDTLDPTNADGEREFFFAHDWLRRVNRSLRNRQADRAVLQSLAGEFDGLIASGCQLSNSSCSMTLLDRQAELFARLNDAPRRQKTLETALALKPSPNWQMHLNRMLKPANRNQLLGSGTGFAVAAGGYVVTNFHVVRDARAIKVKLTGPGRQPLPARLLAHDEPNDLALLKVDLPVVTKLPHARITPRANATPGTQIATIGFALGASEAKYTQGAISQRIEDGNQAPVLVLDQRVNPGNSGGPLFDASGNVVGIVTLKITGEGPIDSYGVALSANGLDRFLRDKLKEYRSESPLTRKLEWAEAVKQITPSIVQVLAETN